MLGRKHLAGPELEGCSRRYQELRGNDVRPGRPDRQRLVALVVFNIPATTTILPKNASATHDLPADTVQSRTDFGTPGYGGPCPPPGKPHHYQFTVYALKIDKLPLDENASAAMVGFYLRQNMIKKTVLTATYGR